MRTRLWKMMKRMKNNSALTRARFLILLCAVGKVHSCGPPNYFNTSGPIDSLVVLFTQLKPGGFEYF